MMIAIACGLGIVTGALIGLVFPHVVRVYRIKQYCYGKGFENGRLTYGALIRRAEEALECRHTLGGLCCRNCVVKARVILSHCQTPVPPRGNG